MKKSLVALAALAAVGAASAQSTVTIYGQLDAAYTHASANNGGASRTGLWNAGMGSSLLGFMGKEDLGGGMYAGFKIEGAINLDNGSGGATNTNNQLTGGVTTGGQPQIATTATSLNGAQGFTFGRYSYINLGGSWGEVRLGRDYSAAFWNFTRFDPFGTNGVAAGSNITLLLRDRGGIASGTNVSNSIGYLTPATLGGFFGQAQVFFGENLTATAPATVNGTNIKNSGDGYALNGGYAAGPISVAASYGVTKGTFLPAGSILNAAARAGEYTEAALAGSYDFGVVKVTALFGKEKIEAGSQLSAGTDTNTTYELGAIVPVGAGNFKASFAHGKIEVNGTEQGNAKQLGLGYDYSLSKRTILYTAFSRIKNGGTTSFYGIGNGSGQIVGPNGAGGAVTAYAFGMKHSF